MVSKKKINQSINKNDWYWIMIGIGKYVWFKVN